MSEINRLIAEKCMGWHIVEGGWGDDFPGPSYYVEDTWIMKVASFDPYHRIEHAHMVLKKFGKDYILTKFEGKFALLFVIRQILPIDDQPELCATYFRDTHWCTTPQAAICEAIKGALEGKE